MGKQKRCDKTFSNFATLLFYSHQIQCEQHYSGRQYTFVKKKKWVSKKF